MKHSLFSQSGFTVVEMIIVVGIIVLLVTGSVIAFSSSRARSRDTKRVSYVEQINKALELYYLQNGIYPTYITAGQTLAVGNTVYLNPVPSNPSPRNDGSCPNQDFSYTVQPRNSDYLLSFCLGSASGRLAAGPGTCVAGGDCNTILPNQISGLLLWLRADSLTLNDGDPISTWNDQSSNGNNASNAAAVGTQPIFKTNMLGGKPAIRYDGIDDILTLANNITTLRHVFVVEKWDNQRIDYVPLLGSTSVYDFHGAPESALPAAGDTDPIVFYAYSSVDLRNGLAWQNGVSTAVTSVYKDRVKFELVEFQPVANLQFNEISNDRGSTSRGMHGDIAEVIVYNTPLGTTDRQTVERYLAKKYNLTISGITY